jgi:hypothetical protein
MLNNVFGELIKYTNKKFYLKPYAGLDKQCFQGHRLTGFRSSHVQHECSVNFVSVKREK